MDRNSSFRGDDAPYILHWRKWQLFLDGSGALLWNERWILLVEIFAWYPLLSRRLHGRFSRRGFTRRGRLGFRAQVAKTGDPRGLQYSYRMLCAYRLCLHRHGMTSRGLSRRGSGGLWLCRLRACALLLLPKEPRLERVLSRATACVTSRIANGLLSEQRHAATLARLSALEQVAQCVSTTPETTRNLST